MLSREHASLLATAKDVIADLHGFEGRLRHGRVHHMQHTVFAERARSLAIYLDSALRLADVAEYTAAFAVLRSSLEHHLTDQLLFLGNRYVRQYDGTKKADYEELERKRRQGEPGTEDIVRVRFNSGTMRVVRSGLHVRDESGARRAQTLSIYYALLEQFDPFVGRPDEQRYLSQGFSKLEHRIENAQEQRATYAWLSWPKLKMNLQENRLYGVENLRRFEVHYRFLSAFVHPVPAGYDLVYGRNRPTGAPKYDHYASELVLLYVNKIAAAELKALKRMTRRTPRVSLRAWNDVESRIQSADQLAAHLWYPGADQPHTFDRVQEANSRGRRGDRFVPRDRRPTPAALKPRQVRYYRNPLRRLIDMHASFNEITGFAYASPWPRDDARRR